MDKFQHHILTASAVKLDVKAVFQGFIEGLCQHFRHA